MYHTYLIHRNLGASVSRRWLWMARSRLSTAGSSNGHAEGVGGFCLKFDKNYVVTV